MPPHTRGPERVKSPQVIVDLKSSDFWISNRDPGRLAFAALQDPALAPPYSYFTTE